MDFDLQGFDELQKDLEDMQCAAQEMDGAQSFNFTELFHPAFMRQYTSYPTIDDFLENCGYPAETQEDFEAIPDKEFDEYVRANTRFSSWEDMLEKAEEELIDGKLGF